MSSMRFTMAAWALTLSLVVRNVFCFNGVAVMVSRERHLSMPRQQRHHQIMPSQLCLDMKDDSDDDDGKSSSDVDEYRNTATKVLSNFMSPSSSSNSKSSSILDEIDFDAPKLRNLPLPVLAQALDAELYDKEWFVTGNVNPVYFSDTFRFQDPDVKLTGIAEYARGVSKIFDSDTARAEIIKTVVNPDQDRTITCTWRLSGKVNIGPAGLVIKPYIVYTDFTVEPDTGLVCFQEDRFDLPGWDILLSALFPFLIGKVTADPAPPVEPRNPPPRLPKLPRNNGNNSSPSPLDAVKNLFGANTQN